MSQIGIAILALALVAWLIWQFAVAPMVRMPGKSFKGPLSPLSDQEQELAFWLRLHVTKLSGNLGAASLTAAPENLETAGMYIENHLQTAGLDTTSQWFKVGSQRMQAYLKQHQPDYPIAPLIGKETRNIIGELPGNGSSDEVIVVGAHYDTPFDLPGANDNRSSIGALLLIALALKGKRLKRTVRFVAFANEEPPFFRTEDMGSAHYAKLCHDRGDRIKAMVCFDTIGYYSNEPGSQKYPKPFGLLYPNTGNFISFVGNRQSRPLVREFTRLFRKNAKFPSQGAAVPQSIPGVDYSDHLWFWHYGYPALMVTDTAFCRYPHYHTYEDTPDKVDYESLARVVSGLIGTIEDLANS
jgi:hypothetical protein